MAVAPAAQLPLQGVSDAPRSLRAGHPRRCIKFSASAARLVHRSGLSIVAPFKGRCIGRGVRRGGYLPWGNSVATTRSIKPRRRAGRTGASNNLAYVACVVLGFAWLLIHFRNEIPAFGFDPSAFFRHQAEAAPQEAKSDLQTGSILLEPADGKICRQRLIDNATWQIRDNGYVDCRVASAQNKQSWHQERTNAIRNSFVHE